MIEQAIAALQNAGFDLTAREIAEILWLSVYNKPKIAKITDSESSKSSTVSPSSSISSPSSLPSSSLTSSSPPPSAPVTLPNRSQSQAQTPPQPSGGIPLKVPAPPALRDSLALAKALRPLKRKVFSYTDIVMDEVATATRIAETRIRLPVFIPAPQRWLDLALVVEQSSTTTIWKQTLVEFQHLLQHQGAFRDIRIWGLKEIEGKIRLLAQNKTGEYTNTTHSPKELIDARGQRLILLVSDCISPLWRKGTLHPVLELWGKQGLLTLLELLPSRLWERTALVSQIPGQLRNLSFDRQLRNYKLTIEISNDEDELPSDFRKTIPVPVVTLDPNSLSSWAKVLVGVGKNATVSYCFPLEKDFPIQNPKTESQNSANSQPPLSAIELVNLFRATASPLARRLAGLMAITPVHISVIYLIQQTLLIESSQLHVAEVFMSGLLKSFPSFTNPNLIEYDFVEGVRDILRQSISPSDSTLVIEKVSEYIAKRYGLSPRSFEALLLENNNNVLDAQTAHGILPFARLKAQVLREWGGEFIKIAEQLEKQVTKQEWFQKLNLKWFSVDVATITFEEETEIGNKSTQSSRDVLPKLKFETVYINKRGEIIRTQECEAYYYEEPLETIPPTPLKKGDKSEVQNLTMIAIPEGEYWMGSPEDEKGRYDGESPQHWVKVPTFFMSQTPITEAQWKFVANLPQEQKALETNPSNNGDDHPVVNISWQDAIEFCARLSRHSRRNYRLPSEAEWEYACRALPSKAPLTKGGQGGSTPFHFGETITSELANYDGSVIYQEESKGEKRGKTTPVRSFKPNAFGLYDMHGNVWEWCLDPWHGNYRGAPTDGSVWDEEYNDNRYHYILDSINVLIKDDRSHVIRGGSWFNFPRLCRSASRYDLGNRDYNNGFRVVCAPQDL